MLPFHPVESIRGFAALFTRLVSNLKFALVTLKFGYVLSIERYVAAPVVNTRVPDEIDQVTSVEAEL